MVLVINNDEVAQVLTVENVMRVLDEAYLDLDKGLTANRPRTFTSMPTARGRFVANTHEGILASKGVYDIRVAAVAKLVHDLAEERGLGKELPLEWFQQDIHS
ncbi:MAG: hypothetical protein GEU73_01065 [Chloroflexi bacterium]|nr:hypothetical protein [Chloroflexota bacterium]